VAILLFPDNTVLINFALISRMDVLSRLANGNGRWCATVALECAESAKRPGLAVLHSAEEIFGAPLYPDALEHQGVRVMRDELAAPGDHARQHLGEAETLAIIIHRGLAASCFFVTDDRGAAGLAHRHGVQAVDTWKLLKVAYKKGWLDADTLWGYVQTLRAQGRGAPREVQNRPSFDKWMTG
jgi:predicted nucleic acid-binding protein